MLSREEIQQLARAIVDEMESRYSAELAPKWEGGSVFLLPGKEGLKEYEIPIDRLLHKIVLIRENLRILEQKINNHEKLSDADKVKLQAYITRCYGSLTTFNVLFYHDEDKFKSS